MDRIFLLLLLSVNTVTENSSANVTTSTQESTDVITNHNISSVTTTQQPDFTTTTSRSSEISSTLITSDVYETSSYTLTNSTSEPTPTEPTYGTAAVYRRKACMDDGYCITHITPADRFIKSYSFSSANTLCTLEGTLGGRLAAPQTEQQIDLMKRVLLLAMQDDMVRLGTNTHNRSSSSLESWIGFNTGPHLVFNDPVYQLEFYSRTHYNPFTPWDPDLYCAAYDTNYIRRMFCSSYYKFVCERDRSIVESCPEKELTFSDNTKHCYYIADYTANYAEAADSCTRLGFGWDLLKLDSMEERYQLFSPAFSNFTGYAWIGLATEVQPEVEHNFTTSFGADFTVVENSIPWASSQPSSDTGCISIISEKESMSVPTYELKTNSNCSSPLNFLCEDQSSHECSVDLPDATDTDRQYTLLGDFYLSSDDDYVIPYTFSYEDCLTFARRLYAAMTFYTRSFSYSNATRTCRLSPYSLEDIGSSQYNDFTISVESAYYYDYRCEKWDACYPEYGLNRSDVFEHFNLYPDRTFTHLEHDFYNLSLTQCMQLCKNESNMTLMTENCRGVMYNAKLAVCFIQRLSTLMTVSSSIVTEVVAKPKYCSVVSGYPACPYGTNVSSSRFFHKLPGIQLNVRDEDLILIHADIYSPGNCHSNVILKKQVEGEFESFSANYNYNGTCALLPHTHISILNATKNDITYNLGEHYVVVERACERFCSGIGISHYDMTTTELPGLLADDIAIIQTPTLFQCLESCSAEFWSVRVCLMAVWDIESGNCSLGTNPYYTIPIDNSHVIGSFVLSQLSVCSEMTVSDATPHNWLEGANIYVNLAPVRIYRVKSPSKCWQMCKTQSRFLIQFCIFDSLLMDCMLYNDSRLAAVNNSEIMRTTARFTITYRQNNSECTDGDWAHFSRTVYYCKNWQPTVEHDVKYSVEFSVSACMSTCGLNSNIVLAKLDMITNNCTCILGLNYTQIFNRDTIFFANIADTNCSQHGALIKYDACPFTNTSTVTPVWTSTTQMSTTQMFTTKMSTTKMSTTKMSTTKMSTTTGATPIASTSELVSSTTTPLNSIARSDGMMMSLYETSSQSFCANCNISVDAIILYSANGTSELTYYTPEEMLTCAKIDESIPTPFVVHSGTRRLSRGIRSMYTIGRHYNISSLDECVVLCQQSLSACYKPCRAFEYDANLELCLLSYNTSSSALFEKRASLVVGVAFSCIPVTPCGEAFQSHTMNGLTADRARDLDLSTCTHTGYNKQAFWMIDLRIDMTFNGLIMFSEGAISYFEVRIGNIGIEKIGDRRQVSQNKLCRRIGEEYINDRIIVISCITPTTGRILSIHLQALNHNLRICEILPT